MAIFSLEPVPSDYDPAYLERQLLRLVDVLQYLETPTVNFTPLHAEPYRAAEGDVVNADGSDWNPGGTGAGLYQYVGGAWTKL